MAKDDRHGKGREKGNPPKTGRAGKGPGNSDRGISSTRPHPFAKSPPNRQGWKDKRPPKYP